MEIARTAARLASVAMEDGERNYEISQAAEDLHYALQDWKGKVCSPDSPEA